MKDEKTGDTGVSYVFGPFRLVPDECLLLRLGEPVPLTPRAFDLLRLLVESAGHLKPREELIGALWPTTIVEESSLPWNVSAVRKALGDDSEAPRYIETVRGRGYRFIAPVTVAGAGKTGGRRRWPWVTAGGLGAAAIVAVAVVMPWIRFFGGSSKTVTPPARPSIAVLPFENLNVDQKDAYFVAGIQDLILTKLADIGDMKVISRTSTANYHSHPDDLETIAHQLGVTTILEGSVQKQGNEVLIDVQLINTETGAHIWAQSYQRTLANVFGVEGDVAEKVAMALNAKLSSSEARHMVTALSTDPLANDLFLRAEYFANRGNKNGDFADSNQAIPLYRQAIARAPDFALARAHLSHVESYLSFNLNGNIGQLVVDAHRQAEQAVKLAPDLADSHLAIGYFDYYGRSDYAAALEAFSAALQLRPNYAAVFAAQGYVLRRQGKFAGAIDALHKALTLDPRSSTVTETLGETYMATGHYLEASQVLRRALALDPNNLLARMMSAYVIAYRTGNLDRALAAVQGDSHILKKVRVKLLTWKRDYPAALALLAGIPDTPVNFNAGGFFFQLKKDIALADLYRLSGDAVQARKHYAKALPDLRAQLSLSQNHPLTTAMLWNSIADADLDLGKTRQGMAAIEACLAALQGSGDHLDGTFGTERSAERYAQARRADKAVPLLAKALATPGIGFGYSPVLLWLDPAWDPIRRNPRFQALLKKYSKYKPAGVSTTAPVSTTAH